MRLTGILFRFILGLVFSLSVMAETLPTLCTGKLINPVTDICWDCLLPITIGGQEIKSSNYPDTLNPISPICICPGNPLPKVGTELGYWEPMTLIDVTRSPFCLVSLGGVSAGTTSQTGDMSVSDTQDNSSFFHVHAYRFPIMQLMGVTPSQCHEGGVFMPEYLSELDPTWEDDSLAMVLFPESSLFGNPATQAACAVDAAAATFNLPSDTLFWCAGSQGGMYPITGHVQEHVGGVQATVLLTERLMFKLHRLSFVQDSSVSDVCTQTYKPIMPKSRYRYQMTYPIATVGNKGCQPFGRSTIPWEALYPLQERPDNQENYGYLIFRKMNCCVF